MKKDNILNSSLIENYLKVYGWKFYEFSPNVLISGWQSKKRFYSLIIEITETLVNLEIKPFIKLQINDHEYQYLLKYLLELNNYIKLAKLSLNTNNEIILSLQIFIENLNYENFANSLGILGYYADELYDLILKYTKNKLSFYSETQEIILPC